MKHNVQENKQLKSKLENLADEHILGVNLDINERGYIAYFHCSHFQVDGIRCLVETSAREALIRLIRKLDDFYNRENGWSEFHTNIDTLKENNIKEFK